MNKILFIIILVAIWSCNSNNTGRAQSIAKNETEKIKDSPNQKSIHTDKNNSLEETTHFNQPFSIDFIKSNTSKFLNKVQVEDTAGRIKIPKQFLENYISKKKTVIGYPHFLTSYYPESYSFQNFKEYKNFILFTFSHFDESCCHNLYAVTSKKDSIDIINIGLIGYMGGDGGWIGEKHSMWKNDSILEATTSSEYDEDFIEENNNTKIDTIWSIIKIDENGKISEKVIDSINYIGDKIIK